ncbi:hypothetical protein FJZ18_01470 [Candidatus Pacearchaeota archaeon]|nr:hypothetical protein [Candidatus Pacearchaeota archaeon]
MSSLEQKLHKEKDSPSHIQLHAIDSVASLGVSQPLWSIIDKNILGIPYEQSLSGRWLGVCLTVGGLGFLMGKSRELYQGLRGVTRYSPENKIKQVDREFLALWSAATCPLYYKLSGGQFDASMFWTTVMATGVGYTIGPEMGMAVDGLRGMSGLGEEHRLPEKIKSLPNYAKKSIVATTAAIALLFVSAWYNKPWDNYTPKMNRIELKQNINSH